MATGNLLSQATAKYGGRERGGEKRNLYNIDSTLYASKKSSSRSLRTRKTSTCRATPVCVPADTRSWVVNEGRRIIGGPDETESHMNPLFLHHYSFRPSMVSTLRMRSYFGIVGMIL